MVSTQRRIETRLRRIDPESEGSDTTDEEIKDQDRAVILEFYDKVKKINRRENRFSIARVLSMLDTLIMISKSVTVPLEQTLKDGERGEEAVEEIVDWMSSTLRREFA